MEYKQKEEIGKILRDKGATLPCHRCGKNEFVILDKGTIPLPDASRPFNSLPTILIGCENCGHVFHHSLGLLGVDPAFGGS